MSVRMREAAGPLPPPCLSPTAFLCCPARFSTLNGSEGWLAATAKDRRPTVGAEALDERGSGGGVSSASSSLLNSAVVHASGTPWVVGTARFVGTRWPFPRPCFGSTTRRVRARATGAMTTRLSSPQGAVARGDFAPDREFCRTAHIQQFFTFFEGRICSSSCAVAQAKTGPAGTDGDGVIKSSILGGRRLWVLSILSRAWAVQTDRFVPFGHELAEEPVSALVRACW